MKIELTEQLWDTLNPSDLPDGTAWMFSNDDYFVIVRNLGQKVFIYNNSKLEQPVIMNIDPWEKIAGIITIEPNHIELQLKENTIVLFNVDNVIPFKRK